MPRLVSVFSDGVFSLWAELGFVVVWLLLTCPPGGGGSFEDDALAFAFLLRAKKDDDDWADILGGFEVLGDIEPLREVATCEFSGLSSFSGCLARKPNVPLEAIVAVDFAPHLNALYSSETWAIRMLADRHHGKRGLDIHVRRKL